MRSRLTAIFTRILKTDGTVRLVPFQHITKVEHLKGLRFFPAMMFFVVWLLRFGQHVMLELLVYTCVDVVTKNTLQDVSEISEKRAIWLCEVGVLLVLSCLMWLFHHTPFVLLTHTLLTLVYAVLLERVNFRYLWLTLWTKWDEFQQHQESMGRLNELRSQMAQGYTNLNGRWAMPQPQPQPPPPAPTYMTYDTAMPPSEAWYPADSDRSQPKMVPLSESPVGYAPTLSTARAGNPMPMQGYSRIPESMLLAASMQRTPPTCSYSPVLPLHQKQLTRRPLHIHHQSPGGPQPPETFKTRVMTTLGMNPYSPVLPLQLRQLMRRPLHVHQQSPVASQQPETFKTRIMTALGMNPYSPTPPGLRNNDENICFLNSVLQCLAHSPCLALGLGQEQERPESSVAQVALVREVTHLLQGLAVMPGMSQISVADPDPVRRAACGLPGTMVSHPRNHQEQQDAAEFLMWMLEALHSVINTAGKMDQRDTGTGGNLAPWAVPRYTSVTLNMLRFIYGDLTPQRIIELKAACRKEIELAGGLDVTGYAEAVQRLADLEWLTYKESEQSVVDGLFTGQLVEALHCTACSRLTVDIQTFRILPVPIGQPRSLNGLVHLEDCFTKFGTVEELYGREGIQCQCCNRRRSTVDNDAAPRAGTPTSSVYASPSNHRRTEMFRCRKLLSDSAIYSSIGGQSTEMLSPIQAGQSDVFHDSGFQDHLLSGRGMCTSTPIYSTGLPVQLTDGQRRSFLRQLPECLIVQLMRFSYAEGQPVKLHRPVTVPLTGLDLTPLIVDTVMQRRDVTATTTSQRYDLYALCVHLGAAATSSGHYISYGKALDGNWYRYNDAKVTAVNMDYELSTRLVRENVYLALYRRTNLS